MILRSRSAIPADFFRMSSLHRHASAEISRFARLVAGPLLCVACAGVLALAISNGQEPTAKEAVRQPNVGYLVVQNRGQDGSWHQTSEPYVPHEGDILFYNDHSTKWTLLYWMVGSDAPYHSGLVYKQPDGLCGAVEAGPSDSLECRTLNLKSRLYDWPYTLYVRRCKKQLTPEKSAEMTKWALAQDHKPYALGRLILQATPVRARGTVRKSLFGATYVDRPAYLCAELVIAGGTIGGIFDPHIHKGNTIYPRDIIFNDVYDLAPLYGEVQVWIPTAIAPPTAPRDPGISPPAAPSARELTPARYIRR
jgi:hypothetical protein